MWKQIKVFGLRYWSISELEENFWILETNSELDLKKNSEKKPKSAWIALLIDFWTRTEFLNLETNSELDLKTKK